jgi:hypothetical protein
MSHLRAITLSYLLRIDRKEPIKFKKKCKDPWDFWYTYNGMLMEIKDVRQIPEEGFRRWFRDDEFDLIVFYPTQGSEEIIAFQLCYRKDGQERVLTWRSRGGHSHNRIDDGEVTYHSKMTPILVADGVFQKEEVLNRFRAASHNLDKRLIHFIEESIRSLTNNRS